MKLLLIFLPCVLGQLLQNGEMESMAHWDCWNIHCQITNDHHSGSHAIAVTGRNHEYEGPSQTINTLKPNGRYRVSGWMKLTNNHQGSMGQSLQIEVAINKNNGQYQYLTAADHPLATTSDGWVHLNGDFNTPAESFKDARVYFQGPVAGVNFIADALTVSEISSSNSWKSVADGVIDRTRKGDINVHVSLDSGISANQVEIDVIQTKKSFPFGTAVETYKYLAGDSRYQNFINQHFNWAVMENALKWPALEPNKGQTHYKEVLQAINKLRSHGIKVRGHNLVWSNGNYVPGWVKSQRGNTLRNTVMHHINEAVGKTKNLVEHWDVNNENLHFHWFQDTLNDINYDIELFRIAHHADPKMALFLNDYDVVTSGGLTGAYRDQGKRIKNANVGLAGMGVQCHFPNNVAPDPTLIKEHLDIIAQAGLPLWVTELDVYTNDENQRANWYATALEALYGHPAVHGILFWGFWDKQHWRGSAASLVSGDSFRINAAGQKVLDLLENKWMTKVYHKPGNSFTVRGFHGDYQIHVKVNGHEVNSLQQHFTMTGGSHNVNIHVHK